jgi:uncharacterized protein (DUF58 family)
MARIRPAFTTRASCLIAAGATALLCGLGLGVVDLVRAGVLALALPVASALVVYRSRVLISNTRAADPARTQAGGAVVIHLTITNRSLLRTGTLMLEDQLPAGLAGRARFVIDQLAGRESRTVSYRMPGLPRGHYRSGPLRIRLTDPFHMVDMTRAFTVTNTFVVTPIVEVLAASEPPRSEDIGDNAGSHSVGTRGADDASTREYRTGDDLRKIHWRSSARMGTLMVRQEERPWQGQTSMLLDLRADAHARAGEDDSGRDERWYSSLEWAISAAASIGSHVLMSRRELALCADPALPQRIPMRDPAALSEYLAGVRAARHRDLEPFAGVLATAARDSALVAIVGALDAASVRALADARPGSTATPAFAVLIDTASWLDPVGSGVDGGSAVPARLLRAGGWRVVVARRGDSIGTVWQGLAHNAPGGMVAGAGWR